MSARYPAYKDSGVEWLGEVPSHWGIPRLAACFDERRTKVSDKDFSPLSVTMRGIVPQIDTAAKTDDGDNRKLVLPGDFVINSRSDRQGSSGLSDLAGSVSLINTVIVPRSLILPKYSEWLLRSVPFQHEFYRWGKGIVADLWTTKFSEMKGITIPLPPLLEQLAIAGFLDGETGKIDGLVAEQRRLIELLREKRQAVISHAVTCGLDPSVPTKPSGIPWLGDVPEHWTPIPIRKAARLESGHTPSRSRPDWWQNCTVPWFGLADVWKIRNGQREYVVETKEMVSELGLANSSARLLPAGTVILSRTASVGYSAIMGVDMATTQDFANWVCGPQLLPEFLLYCFRGMPGEFERLMMGSTHNTIYMPDIMTLTIGLPPVSEQRKIVNYIRTEVGKLDSLMAEAERAIALLQERRSALISAAVTGKIDVRRLAPAAARNALETAPETEAA